MKAVSRSKSPKRAAPKRTAAKKPKTSTPHLETKNRKTCRDLTPLRAREGTGLPGVGKSGPKPYDWRPIYLKALRESIGLIQPAAEAAGITRQTATAERKANPEFDEACDLAVAAGVDDLELHALDLARGKMSKGIYFEGERVAQEAVQFEKTLHKALAKHRPEWSDRTELTGKGGKPLIPENVRSFDLEAMTDEELNALRTRIDFAAAAAH